MPDYKYHLHIAIPARQLANVLLLDIVCILSAEQVRTLHPRISPPLALALSPLSLHYTDTLMYIFSLALALFDINFSKQGTM